MKNWETKPLGEFIEERTERLRENSATVYSVTNDSGFVRSLDLFDKQVFSKDTSNYKRVGFFDLAYNPSRINVGSIAMLTDENGGAVSPMYVIVRCKPGLLPHYLLQFLKSDAGQEQIRHRCEGTVRFQLKFRDLCAIPIPVPSLVEQERIVKLLDEADALLKLRAQTDHRTADLIPALFNEMFGGATPANTRWPSKALGAVGKAVTGNTPSRKVAHYYGTFVEWVKTDNINALAGRVERAAEALSAEGGKCGRVVPAGSVLMTCIAGSRDRIGDAAVSDREVAINQQINAIIPNSETDAIFLCELIRALKPEIQRRATGVMTGIINKSSLEQIESINPPPSVQKEFGCKVREIRMMQADQATSRQRLDDFFQSMLHRAFSGGL
jgi:type I restriction enzyme S subunit